ncbi:hypothetical protein WG922_21925, partial [Ramlibacter sp. AN1015]
VGVSVGGGAGTESTGPSGAGIGLGGASGGIAGSRPVSGAGIGLGRDSGSARSTSRAGISGIAGDASVRSDDAEAGVARIFDADRVQRDVDAQVQIMQTFGRDASQAWGTYANRQYVEAVANGDERG